MTLSKRHPREVRFFFSDFGCVWRVGGGRWTAEYQVAAPQLTLCQPPWYGCHVTSWTLTIVIGHDQPLGGCFRPPRIVRNVDEGRLRPQKQPLTQWRVRLLGLTNGLSLARTLVVWEGNPSAICRDPLLRGPRCPTGGLPQTFSRACGFGPTADSNGRKGLSAQLRIPVLMDTQFGDVVRQFGATTAPTTSSNCG